MNNFLKINYRFSFFGFIFGIIFFTNSKNLFIFYLGAEIIFLTSLLLFLNSSLYENFFFILIFYFVQVLSSFFFLLSIFYFEEFSQLFLKIIFFKAGLAPFFLWFILILPRSKNFQFFWFFICSKFYIVYFNLYFCFVKYQQLIFINLFISCLFLIYILDTKLDRTNKLFILKLILISSSFIDSRLIFLLIEEKAIIYVIFFIFYNLGILLLLFKFWSNKYFSKLITLIIRGWPPFFGFFIKVLLFLRVRESLKLISFLMLGKILIQILIYIWFYIKIFSNIIISNFRNLIFINCLFSLFFFLFFLFYTMRFTMTIFNKS